MERTYCQNPIQRVEQAQVRGHVLENLHVTNVRIAFIVGTARTPQIHVVSG